ncbi:hypothetical protein LCGC14_0559750 [marine sediment metagenome]|uniref:Uncharacterized protein n=1 Tax=marine sediment metagenome TaxID=412755 RepID=A0A0F9UVK7_9ZZZZ|nr:hypothetical protein [Maribacter sp.]HDZ07214.1 hypothetical protein [Maribacter sp.]HEA80611.1 hypothetical protein [Maribacter sp.]
MIKTEICKYCGDDYIPKRRGAQKFCSNSCRSLNWKNNQPIQELKVPVANSKDEEPIIAEKPSLQEKMSLAGIANAAVGVAAVELAKDFVTPYANKPATKKDIEDLKAFLKSRYFLVKNMRRDIHGRQAYFDIVTGNIIYK